MNNTPLQSPVKFEKHKKIDKKLFSPLTVSNRQISLDECILTPSKTVVQVSLVLGYVFAILYINI